MNNKDFLSDIQKAAIFHDSKFNPKEFPTLNSPKLDKNSCRIDLHNPCTSVSILTGDSLSTQHTIMCSNRCNAFQLSEYKIVIDNSLNVFQKFQINPQSFPSVSSLQNVHKCSWDSRRHPLLLHANLTAHLLHTTCVQVA